MALAFHLGTDPKLLTGVGGRGLDGRNVPEHAAVGSVLQLEFVTIQYRNMVGNIALAKE